MAEEQEQNTNNRDRLSYLIAYAHYLRQHEEDQIDGMMEKINYFRIGELEIEDGKATLPPRLAERLSSKSLYPCAIGHIELIIIDNPDLNSEENQKKVFPVYAKRHS